jgi:hypothetical protein
MSKLSNAGQLFSPFVGLFVDTGSNTFYGIDIRNLNSPYYYEYNNLTYIDSIPAAAGVLKNVILDTLTKRVYAFYQNYLSILCYSYVTEFSTLPNIKVINPLPRNAKTFGTFAYTNSRNGLYIQSPNSPFIASLYSLSGRLLDRKECHGGSTITTWKPRISLSDNFYILNVESRGVRQSFKIMLP